MDNPIRRALFRAGHAHAGVLLILALVVMPYVDASTLGGSAARSIRLCFTLAPILMPAGFFLSMARSSRQEPSRLIWLTYAGGVSLAAGAVGLGLALLFR